MIEGVAAVWMPVQDMQRALGFYEEKLGFPVLMRSENWAELDVNGLKIGLNAREARGAREEGGPVVTFQPQTGLDAAVEELKGRGVRFPGEVSEHSWGRVATFEDTEGNDLQLYEPPRG